MSEITEINSEIIKVKKKLSITAKVFDDRSLQGNIPGETTLPK
jgi:hypothetical protein